MCLATFGGIIRVAGKANAPENSDALERRRSGDGVAHYTNRALSRAAAISAARASSVRREATVAGDRLSGSATSTAARSMASTSAAPESPWSRTGRAGFWPGTAPAGCTSIRASQEQREALEAGHYRAAWRGIRDPGRPHPAFLPSEEARIEIEANDEQTRARVGEIGEAVGQGSSLCAEPHGDVTRAARG